MILSSDKPHLFRIIFREVLVTKCAHLRLTSGPFTKPKVVKLPLEAGILAMVKIFRQDRIRHGVNVHDLKARAIVRPVNDFRVFGLEDLIKETQELWNANLARAGSTRAFVLQSHGQWRIIDVVLLSILLR